MRAKEKMYMLALMTLVLMGISAAWAGYNGTLTAATISTQNLASVSAGSGVGSKTIPKFGFFHWTISSAFTIQHTDTSTPRVVHIILVNAAELRKYVRYLNVKVTVSDGSNTPKTAYLTLTKPEEIIDTTSGLSLESDWTVSLEIWGFAWKTPGSSADIIFDCEVEPAQVLEASA